MKIVSIIFLFIVATYYLLPSPLFAQAADPTLIPTINIAITQPPVPGSPAQGSAVPLPSDPKAGDILNGSCGFADATLQEAQQSGYNSPTAMCCKLPPLTLGTLNNPIVGFIHSIPGINFLVDGVAGIDMGKLSGIDKLIQECYIGAPYRSANSCTCVINSASVESKSVVQLCQRYASEKERTSCLTCAGADASGNIIPGKPAGLLTGMGCIPLELNSFVSGWFFPRAVGIAGLIAFMCILVAAFRIQMSRGDKEALQKAREMMTSCIIGLLIIIFAVFILQIIGVTILKIPGLSKG